MITKHLLAALGLTIGTLAFGQITITSDDLPIVGEQWQAHWDNDGGPDFGPTPAGADQYWNWTNAFSVDETLTYDWNSPEDNAGNDLFPSATLAWTADGSSAFYNVGLDGLSVVGSYYTDNDLVRIQYSEGGLVLPTPFTMNSTRSTEVVITTVVIPGNGNDASRSVSYQTSDFNCDAWGTLTTPAYPLGASVLRIHLNTVHIMDSTFTDASGTGNGPWTFTSTQALGDTSSWYLYVQNGLPAVVAETSGDGDYALYNSSTSQTGVLNGTMEPTEALAYPVPSLTGMVSIRPNEVAAVRVEILNATGEVVNRLNTQKVDIIHLNTADYAVGAYHFRCFNVQGEVVGQGQFVVAD